MVHVASLIAGTFSTQAKIDFDASNGPGKVVSDTVDNTDAPR